MIEMIFIDALTLTDLVFDQLQYVTMLMKSPIVYYIYFLSSTLSILAPVLRYLESR